MQFNIASAGLLLNSSECHVNIAMLNLEKWYDQIAKDKLNFQLARDEL